MVVAQCGRERGEEVLEPGGAGDAQVGKGEHVGSLVAEGQLETLDLAHTTFLVNISLGSFNGQTTRGNTLHLRREQAPGFREVWKNEANDDSNEASDSAFDDVQPLPCRKAPCALQAVENTSGDKIAESAADERARIEDTHAQRQLFLCIPLGQIEQDAGEEGGFSETQNEPAGNDSAVALDLRSQGGHETPGRDEEANVQRRTAHVVEQQVRRNLHENVGDEQNRQAGLILLVTEVQIFCQTLQFGRCIVIPATMD